MSATEINKITVVGPGMMGHAIAQEFASAGYAVILCGRSEERLQQALQDMERNLRELAEWDIISIDAVKPALNRIKTTTSLEAAGSDADLVVESIIEDLEVKQQLFKDLDRHARRARYWRAIPPVCSPLIWVLPPGDPIAC